MITLPIYVIFLVFLGILMGLEINRRKKISFSERINELEDSIRLLREELDELETLKSEMLSRIGISLKKPLESVRETVIELSRPLDRSPEVKEQLARLIVEIEEIENFLSVMKELAALENMDLTRESHQNDDAGPSPVLLDSLLFETLNEWNDLFSERGISLALSLDENIRISGNTYYLRHALDNIFTEITRIMGSGTLIHIVLKERPDSVRVTLTCKGSRQRDSEQSAFGVELARQIISAHKGWLTGDTDSGQFAIELPLYGKNMGDI
ncbi:MAG: hypothetical protein JXR55_09595 [Candidatus Fermentibacteraceae bacterium]|nr:hypothetical protein [Candidatus Fermentibacteraceae bacterium]